MSNQESKRRRTVEPTVYGVFEGCIGCTHEALPDLLSYFALQGFTPAGDGTLTASECQALYGVDSALESIRLRHNGGADHGLLRLMVWSRPTSKGLGTRGLATRGGRWTASMTDDVLGIANHCEIACASEADVRYASPQWTVIYGGESGAQAFKGPLVGVREALFFRPLTRQVFFQRWGYEIPTYGTTASDATLRTSQVTHFGLIVEADSNDDPTINFYGEALGLLRARDCREATSYKPGRDAATAIWGFTPGATGNYNIDFDDPRSSTDWKKARSGRLKLARYPKESRAPLEECEDGPAACRPGALGLSLYTFRTPDPEGLRERVLGHGATAVTGIAANEFGERSFSFAAPDGSYWNIVEGGLSGTVAISFEV